MNQAHADTPSSVIESIGRAVEQKILELNISTPTESAHTEAPLQDVDYTAHVGEILQNDTMPAGCEIISLEIAMESMGLEVDPSSLVYDHLDMNSSFSTGYSGDPYWEGGGFAPGITAAANSYLESTGQTVRAYDLTGSSFDAIANYVAHGYPALVWTTMEFEDPYFTGDYDEEDEWYSNEHCVVLYGFTDDGEYALVSDPMEGYVEREKARFIDIFEQCGKRAIILR